MFSKESNARISIVCGCLGYTALTCLAFYGLWPRIGMVPSGVILISLGIGFYFLAKWIVVARPAELDKKFPTISAELRRRKKEFFDSLASRGKR